MLFIGTTGVGIHGTINRTGCFKKTTFKSNMVTIVIFLFDFEKAISCFVIIRFMNSVHCLVWFCTIGEEVTRFGKVE